MAGVDDISNSFLSKRQHFTTASKEFKLTSVITSLDPPAPTPGPNPRSSNPDPDMLIFDPDPTVLLAWLVCNAGRQVVLLLAACWGRHWSAFPAWTPTNLPPGHSTPRAIHLLESWTNLAFSVNFHPASICQFAENIWSGFMAWLLKPQEKSDLRTAYFF